jgi:hypothetical protein
VQDSLPAVFFTVSTAVLVVGLSALIIWLRRLWFKKVDVHLEEGLHDHVDRPILRTIPLTSMGVRCVHYYVVVFLVWLIMILWLHSRGTLDLVGVTAATVTVAAGVTIAMLRRFKLLNDKGMSVFKKRRGPDV